MWLKYVVSLAVFRETSFVDLIACSRVKSGRSALTSSNSSCLEQVKVFEGKRKIETKNAERLNKANNFSSSKSCRRLQHMLAINRKVADDLALFGRLIPIWKRELLQRIHAKNDAVRNKLLLDRRNFANEDTAVINEHILKVSENFFVKMELQHQIKSPCSPSQRTHRENQQENNGEQFTYDSGLVSRLKGQYSPATGHRVSVAPRSVFEAPLTPVKFRSKSSVEKPRVEQSHDDTFTTSTNNFLKNSSQQDPKNTKPGNQPRARKTSIDVITPKGFSRTPSYSVTSPSFHKVSSPPIIKKFSAPITSKRKTASDNGDTFDSSSSARNVAVISTKDNVSVSEKTGNDLEFLPGTVTTSTVTAIPSGKNQFSERINANEKLDNHRKPSSKSNESTPKTIPFKPVPKHRKGNLPPADDKLFDEASVLDPGLVIIEISSSFVIPAASSQNGNISQTIVGSDHTLLDSSVLKTKTISEEHKTTKVSQNVENFTYAKKKTTSTPSAQTDLSSIKPAQSENNRAPTVAYHNKNNLNKLGKPPAKLPKPKLTNYKSQKDNSKPCSQENSSYVKAINSQTQKSTPIVSRHAANINEPESTTSFAPDVIKKDTSHNAVLANLPHDNASISTIPTKSNDLTKKETGKNNDITTKKPKASDVKIQKREEYIQQTLAVEKSRDNEKSETVTNQVEKDVTQTSPNTPVRRKLSGPGVTSTSTFGGKTFMIDPSKFKKNPQSNLNKALQAETTANRSGKRKLRVDQIVVIGGYVKLERSSFLEPNKIRKEIHVKFLDSSLELVFNYPSENSLLQEAGENNYIISPSEHAHLLPSKRDSQLDNITAKALLAMKQDDLNSSDEDD